MKKVFLLCAVLVASAASVFAQSSTINVANNTSCEFLVEMVALSDDCNSSCTTTVVCIAPSSNVNITPCNPNWYWDHAIVTPADAACDPCSSSIVVSSPAPTNCTGQPTVVTDNHCTCGTYTADFGSLTAMEINP